METNDAGSVALFRALNLASRQLNAAIETALQDAAGISLPEFDILTALAQSEGQRARAGELGIMLAWEKSRTSHQVARMERRGLVERGSCDADLRGTFVHLTADGSRAIAAASPAYRGIINDMLEGISGTPSGEALGLVALEIGRRVTPSSCQAELASLEKDLSAEARP